MPTQPNITDKITLKIKRERKKLSMMQAKQIIINHPSPKRYLKKYFALKTKTNLPKRV